MSQGGFSELCGRIGVEEMSFEACYLMYLLVPDVEDVMTVCSSQSALQKAVEGLGCRLVSDCPPKLRSKKAAMVGSFDMHSFQPFFRWMFEMGKSISAMNTGAHVGVVRSVPIEVSKMRPTPLESPRRGWPHHRRRRRCADGAAVDGGRSQRLVLDGQVQRVLLGQGPRALQQGPLDADRPLCPPGAPAPCLPGRMQHTCAALATRARWGRSRLLPCASQTTTGQIEPDLSNYEDDGSGGGSAWPCMIDDFVEWALAQ